MNFYTPGPLTAVGGVVINQDEMLIADCGRKRPEPGDSFASNRSMSVEEIKGNAALFAAAPNLLEALEWLVNLDCGVGKFGGNPEVNEYEEAIDFGKSAIAKAKGEDL